eukprot:Seg2124.4 transcript_id=Seg2124.4/GoldUCD/mRNA.D3Y31 product="Follistatin-related protein 5" protein_id=Seg2124.4/GoldUCD/D3Y31
MAVAISNQGGKKPMSEHEKPRKTAIKYRFIKGVGLAANTTDAALNKFYYINKFSYAKILKAEGRNYSQAEFHYYVYLHFMDHVNRAISVGCHADVCYAASPSYFTHKIALMDVKKNRLLSLIGGLYWPQEMIWVGEDPSKKVSSSATCHGSYSVFAFLAILLLTCNASSVCTESPLKTDEQKIWKSAVGKRCDWPATRIQLGYRKLTKDKMDVKSVAFLVVLAIVSSRKMVASVSSGASTALKLPVRGVFYVFDEDGIAILDPKTLKLTKRIDKNALLPGTKQRLCSINNKTPAKCYWGGAVYIADRYIIAADPLHDRVIVTDVEKQATVRAIGVDVWPYELQYVAAVDEIWVTTWSSKLNAIGVERSAGTRLSKLTNASLLVVKKSVDIKNEGLSLGLQGYFRAENCQNPDQDLKFGVALYEQESGIHKINLAGSAKFIKLAKYGCKAASYMEYSSVKKYAIVKCSGEFSEIIVVDVATEQVVHWNDAMVKNAIGRPYVAPDGKYVMITQYDRIITYYFESPTENMVRLKDIYLASDFPPSTVGFVKRVKGYTAYVTSMYGTRIMLIKIQKGTTQIMGFINEVGNGVTFNQRPIYSGCDPYENYIASPAEGSDEIALIDAQANTLRGLIGGFRSPRSMIWVKNAAKFKIASPSAKKARSAAMCHGPGVIMVFLVLVLITFA